MKNSTKLINLIFLFVSLSILFLGLGYALLQRHDTNVYENRPSNKFIFKETSFWDQSFQDKIEDTFADQLPKSTQMKSFYNKRTGLIVDFLNKPFLDKVDTYTPYHGLTRYKKHITYSPKIFKEIESDVKHRVNNLNDVIKSNPNINYYTYYIERDMDLNFDTNEKVGVYHLIQEELILNENHIENFEIKDFSDYEDYFYKTDHHWNARGSYTAYKEILNLTSEGTEKPQSIIDEHCLVDSYTGTKASTAGISDFIYEDMCAYLFELPDHKTYINGVEKTYGNKEEFFKDELGSLSYGGVFGGDDAIVHFDYNNPQKGNTIIFGESFDNPIIELIASHYNNTYAIDLRNFKSEMTFNFREFVEENKIDNVIFVGSITYFTNSELDIEGY